jgi:hypothetical protein
MAAASGFSVLKLDEENRKEELLLTWTDVNCNG